MSVQFVRAFVDRCRVYRWCRCPARTGVSLLAVIVDRWCQAGHVRAVSVSGSDDDAR